jgi:hypothetical protein
MAVPFFEVNHAWIKYLPRVSKKWKRVFVFFPKKVHMCRKIRIACLLISAFTLLALWYRRTYIFMSENTSSLFGKR